MRRPEDLTEAERASGKNVAVDFFARFKTIESLGLVSKVPTLHEADDGEPIHPLHPMSEIPLEAQRGHLPPAVSSAHGTHLQLDGVVHAGRRKLHS